MWIIFGSEAKLIMLKTEVIALEHLTVLFLLISSTMCPERCHITEELQKLRQRE